MILPFLRFMLASDSELLLTATEKIQVSYVNSQKLHDWHSTQYFVEFSFAQIVIVRG